MKIVDYEFEDEIFKHVFSKRDYYDKLVDFISRILDKDVLHLKILDSSYMEEDEEKFSIHLFMSVDSVSIWLVFAFGDERDYLKEEYYCQTNDGIRMYGSSPIIRYNMKKICDEFDKNNQEMVLNYGFILEVFEELVENIEML